MNRKNHKTEDLGNWKPFVELLQKEWDRVKSEPAEANSMLGKEIWKGIDRKLFFPRRYILRTLWTAAAVFIGVMCYWGYFKVENHVAEKVAYMEHTYAEGRMYVLPDSSVVWLEPGSKIQISSDFLKKRELWLTGSSVFEVKKRNQSEFKVYIHTACIEVKGTVFSVNQLPSDVSVVTLYEGAIDFVGKNQASVSLVPSQRLIYDIDKGMTQVENFSENIQWQDGHYSFTDIQIASLVDFIRKKYRVEVQLDKEINRGLLLTGTIRYDESLESVMEKICFSSHLNYQKQGSCYKLTK